VADPFHDFEEDDGIILPPACEGAAPPPLPPKFRKPHERKTASPAMTGQVLPPDKPVSIAEAKRVAKSEQTRLTARFTNDIRALWEEQGQSIMRRAAFADPLGTMKVIASMLPKQIDVTTTNVEEIDNDKLDRLIGAVDDILAGRLGAVADKASGREGEEG
jgi:hypothetical protein